MHENIELNNESDQLISNIEIKIDIEKPKDEFPKKSQMLSSISLNFQENATSIESELPVFRTAKDVHTDGE